MKIGNVISISSIFIIVLTANAFSRSHGFTIYYGVPVVFGNDSKFLNAGYNYGINFLSRYSRSVQFGCRFGVCYWEAQKSPGSMFSLELVPTMRIVSDWNDSTPVKMFYQLGCGIFLMDGSAGARSKDIVLPTPFSYIRPRGKAHDIFAREGLFGMNFGIGIISNNDGIIHLELLPMINIGFTEDKWTSYLSCNIGLKFGIQ